MKLTARSDDAGAEIIRKHAALEGVPNSAFLRDTVFEKIGDARDLADLRAAIAADGGDRYSLADIRAEFGL